MTPPRQEIPPWVIVEAERKPRRKPGSKPKIQIPPARVHVKVNLSGSVDFDLEGDEAVNFISMLTRLELDDVLEFVDPWASGAELRYDVEVIEVGGREWEANEATGTIELRTPWRF